MQAIKSSAETAAPATANRRHHSSNCHHTSSSLMPHHANNMYTTTTNTTTTNIIDNITENNFSTFIPNSILKKQVVTTRAQGDKSSLLARRSGDNMAKANHFNSCKQSCSSNDNTHSKLSLIVLLSVSIMVVASLSQQANAFEYKSAASVAEEQDFDKLGLHYSVYLKQVVAALDKDQKFTETIKNMDANDIKSGKVAEQLKHVNEDVRKKLNDLKYIEIMRLKDLATKKNELETHGEVYHGTDKRRWRTLGASLSEIPEHIGSDAGHFDVNDLHKLMVAATKDLEKLDTERKEDYKKYEMEKEWQFQERLKMLNETEKAEAIRLRNELKAKHDDHPKVHEPGSKQHLEEVWEKKDHLPKAEFDPKTFFVMHDKNSDNYWDQTEVKELLVSEITKLYDPKNPEDDPNEMDEEYERMREHIYKEIDADKDGLIGLREFLDYSKKPEFKSDHGWDDVSKKEAYSKNEYDYYQKHREQQMAQMHGNYDMSHYAHQPENHHLPNWGYGMPLGANPAQYYGYGIDPNHPHAQQVLAQQQQHLAYQQQAAYHQQAAAGVPYGQPAVNPQAFQQPPQAQQYQQPQIAQQPAVQQQQQQQPQVQVQQQQPQQVQVQQQQPPQYQQASQQYQQPQPQYQQPQHQQFQQAAPQQQYHQQQQVHPQVPQVQAAKPIAAN